MRNRAVFLTLLSGGLLLSCTEASDESIISRPVRARQYIVGIDISGSRTEAQLKEGQAVLLDVIAQLRYSDRLVMIETYQRGRDDGSQSVFEMPAARDTAFPTVGERKKLSRAIGAARAVAPSFFRAGAPVMSTDLFSTFHRAAQYATARPQDTTIVFILSDMLHSTRELDMERGTVPSRGWIEARKSEGTLPDLRGACVVIDGADVSSASGARVRAFWLGWLTAAGAGPVKYRNMISDAAEVSCGA